VKQQEKIEEIYLHLIEMNKRMKALEAENEELKKEIEALKN
jgi:cell division protein FtsB